MDVFMITIAIANIKSWSLVWKEHPINIYWFKTVDWAKGCLSWAFLQVPDVQFITDTPHYRCANIRRKEIVAPRGFRTECEYNLTFFDW